jgi:monoamine oxidase
VEKEGEIGWAKIAASHDEFSVREFLEHQNWSEGAIERFGLLFNQEAILNSSFLELLREEIGQYYTDMVYLPRGSDELPGPLCPAWGHGCISACASPPLNNPPKRSPCAGAPWPGR